MPHSARYVPEKHTVPTQGDPPVRLSGFGFHVLLLRTMVQFSHLYHNKAGVSVLVSRPPAYVCELT